MLKRKVKKKIEIYTFIKVLLLFLLKIWHEYVGIMVRNSTREKNQ